MNQRIRAQSDKAKKTLALVESLQQRFAEKLSTLCAQGWQDVFELKEWFRQGGEFGGGTRLEALDKIVFNRGSINVSQVHYDSAPEKSLASATALSTIIHPNNPHAPSLHMHVSHTEMKNGKCYWRMMCDLNPAILNDDHEETFIDTLKRIT